jgi:hypothetical protein
MVNKIIFKLAMTQHQILPQGLLPITHTVYPHMLLEDGNVMSKHVGATIHN